jgi:myo-inositol-1(or 4)-monophosphatase
VKPLEELAQIAERAVTLGAELVRNATPHQVTEKSDRDVVTDVDIKVEQEVRAYLHRVTPECGFLGEEEGQIGIDEYAWILDPVDGTSNFTRGLPLCAVSLALVHEGRPLVAGITAPFLDLHYTATRGAGSFVNGQRMHASRTSELRKAIVSIGDYAVGENAEAKNKQRLRLTALLAERVERVRMFGSAALDLAWVAEGRTDATIMLANKPWDTAAGVLLAREAGALVVDSSGEPHTFHASETIAVCPGLVDTIVALARDTDRA